MKYFFSRFALVVLLTSLLTVTAAAADRVLGEVNCDVLNVREQPSVDSAVKGKVKIGEQLLIIEQLNDWYKIRYNTTGLYVRAEYIDLLSGEAIPSKMAGTVTGSVVNLRSGADINAAVLGKYSKDTKLVITDINGDWLAVTIGGVSGYMHSDYVLITAGNPADIGAGATTEAEAILDYAYQYLGVAYKFGGTSAAGFDCSGFTRFVFSSFGINLTHSATTQSTEGASVAKADLIPGDLVFFKNPDNFASIGHVGIYVGNNSFIHATSPGDVVKVDSLVSSYYSKYYVCAARVLGD